MLERQITISFTNPFTTMNKFQTLYLCLITMAISPVSIFGQEDSYGLKENISYYSDSHSDPYLQERCKLETVTFRLIA